MQIKKFRANDTAEALRLIRKDFGSRAVILSTKDVEAGSSLFGFRKKHCVEVTAATDAEIPKSDSASDAALTGKSFRKSIAGNSVRPKFLKKRRSASLSSREMGVNAVRKTKPTKMRNGFSRKPDHRMQFFSLYKELQDQGVKEQIAMDLVKELGRYPSLKRPFGEEELRQNVIRTLGKMGVVTKPIKVKRGEQKIAALVGPAGVGKSTTIAKLAGMGGLKHSRKLGMITLDNRKIGAVGEMEVYSRILDVPMEIAFTRGQLEQALHNLRRKDIILIDTPGISRNENMVLRRIKDLLQCVASAEVHLLVSATTREKGFSPIVARFKPLNIKSLMFTRLDDCIEHGNLVNHLIETGVPVSYFTNGPQVPENIEVATLDRLVKLILKKNHARQISVSPKPAGVDKVTPPMVYGPYLEKSYAYS